MTPDRAKAAAVACEELAAALDRASAHVALIAHVAGRLEAVPLTHPLRGWPDKVLDVARAARASEATAEGLRAFAGELRDGAAEMAATGWYRTVFGGRP